MKNVRLVILIHAKGSGSLHIKVFPQIKHSLV